MGQNVSVAYVYRLMQRHERRRPAPPMRMPRINGDTGDLARPPAEAASGAQLKPERARAIRPHPRDPHSPTGCHGLALFLCLFYHICLISAVTDASSNDFDILYH